MSLPQNIKDQPAHQNYWYLKGISKDVLNMTFSIEKAKIVGRSKNSDIHIPIIRLSRQHSRLTHFKDGILVEDLGSSNGTFINGKKIIHTLAKHGDTISFDNIHFKVYAPQKTDTNTLHNREKPATKNQLPSRNEDDTAYNTKHISSSSDTIKRQRNSLDKTKLRPAITASDILDADKKSQKTPSKNLSKNNHSYSAIEKQQNQIKKKNTTAPHIYNKLEREPSTQHKIKSKKTFIFTLAISIALLIVLLLFIKGTSN